MTDGKTTLIRVTRIFAASAERVFDAWLDPVLARKFLFVTAAGTMQRIEIEAKVGGRFLIVEKREAGDASHYGVYLEIDRPRRLVFAFSVEKFDPAAPRVAIDIVQRGSGCELTLTQELPPAFAAYADRAQTGWTHVLQTLDRALGVAR